MTRFILCASIACLAASCAPNKAILIEAAPEVKPKPNKPAGPQSEEVAPMQVAQERKGMRVRDPSKELPEGKDFTPTAPTVNNANAVIASPPGGTKPAPAPAPGDKPSE